MDRLEAMRVFVAVVERGGFSAAARALGMALPTVSRKVGELEALLGVQLLTRTTRKVTPTDSGQRFYRSLGPVLSDLAEAEREARGEYRRPTGHLSLTAPTLFGRRHVLPVAQAFLDAHDEIDIHLHLTDRVTDLMEERVNLGFRIGALTDNSLSARRVGDMRLVVCASPEYLDRHGRPAVPEDLERLHAIQYLGVAGPAPWRFADAAGSTRQIAPPARLVVNSSEGTADAAADGHGAVQLLAYQAAPLIAAGKLEIVLAAYELPARPVSLIYPRGRLVAQKVRAFIDFAAPRLAARLAEVARQCAAP